MYEQIPDELKKLKQWCAFQLVWDEERGKNKKIPMNANTGAYGNSVDERTWADFETALASLEKYQFDGLGFYFKAPYFGVDIDNIKDDIQDYLYGNTENIAGEFIQTLASYTEYSVSGTGIHIIAKGEFPEGGRRKGNIEMYPDGRFFVMTGQVIDNYRQVNEATSAIKILHEKYIGKTENTSLTKHQNSSNNLSESEILEKAYNSKNGPYFKTLYEGNWEAYYASQSDADLAFANMLAFWTAADYDKMDVIFRDSGLMRDKWDQKRGQNTYGQITLGKAISGCSEIYSPKQSDNSYNISLNSRKNLAQLLNERRKKELEKLKEEWLISGGKGKQPSVISPIGCAIILKEFFRFCLFDMNENTRLAMYLEEDGIWTQNETYIRRFIGFLEPTLNANKASDVIYHLWKGAEVKEKTASRYLIPVKNGVFNLKTKKLEAFTPNYVFTSKIATPYVSEPPKPDIKGWDIHTWLDEIACGDEQITALLWQVISASLNGNYSRKESIWLLGDGNNGKGTFQQLLHNIIGTENIATLKLPQFQERFALSILEEKVCCIGDDVPSGVYIDDSSNFNSVVTGDNIMVEQKNKQPYGTSFRMTVIQSTNGMPKMKNKTNGTYRRFVIVPFKADLKGGKDNWKIKDEYINNPELLQYVLFHAINMDFERFVKPDVSLELMEEYQQENDPILDYYMSEFQHYKSTRIPVSTVYEFYKIFCETNNFKPKSASLFHKHFDKILSEKGWDKKRQRLSGKYDPIDTPINVHPYRFSQPIEAKVHVCYTKESLEII
ncbi:phage/plasmid primase, P4 family [Listeria monocytogenes]|uniref:phage/plasmid primase, P4 family n=2 Tax=Listeria monocytogenes TaxID=1639 RepID=UPI00073B0351|nr:phage/plasmid primase, P4 family [Listeria monocytogenes]EEP3939407.1 DNA primase [Listeria monocytogenes serotype 1/2b]ASH35207.1 phage DNA primase [Listeria monocytogenes serotype 1/2b str. 10-0810]ASH38178.1 phage DNA primase [Listeria monocytogenes serotype 1/2b str. 10-0811]ASH41076.1 phage-related DNA primase [Listeria monocytogenes serotype 1/2a str. 10-0812]ASH43962.1 phage-related DNA primase [Listeria monocytogenes serotype 1/2a str. 10-0813]